MKLPAPAVVLALLLLVPSLSGGIVEEQRLIEPFWSPPWEAPQVVASRTGMFLANGFRVTRDGNVLDSEPLTRTGDVLMPWTGGWIALERPWDRNVRRFRRIGEDGSTAPFISIDSLGQLVSAASGRSSVALLESWTTRQRERVMYLTVTDGAFVRRLNLGTVTNGYTSPTGDGWLLMTSRPWEHDRTLVVETLWKLDRHGNVAGRIESPPKSRSAVADTASDGSNTALLECSGGIRRVRVIGSSLEELAATGLGRCVAGSIHHIEGGFLVLSRPQDSPDHAIVVSLDGRIIWDSITAPIAALAGSGNRYFVARSTTGSFGIADGHPLNPLTPAEIPPSRPDGFDRARAIVSGDTTLVLAGSNGVTHFMRVGSGGFVVDPEPVPLPRPYEDPTSLPVVAVADGFLMFWIADEHLKSQLVPHSGAPAAVRLVTPVATGTRTNVAAHAAGGDILVAWRDNSAVRWLRMSPDETIVSGGHADTPPGTTDSFASLLQIAGTASARLITLSDLYHCPVLCPPGSSTAQTVIALDAGFAMVNAPLRLPTRLVTSRFTVRLSDGSWILANDLGEKAEVHHLSAEGLLLASHEVPLLGGPIVDARPVAGGWEAIVGAPFRIVRLSGAANVVSMTGLDDVVDAAFLGDRFVFSRGVPPSVSTGAIQSRAGNLSITASPSRRSAGSRFVDVTVRNESTSEARNIVVSSDTLLRFVRTNNNAVTIDSLAPGAHVTLPAVIDYGNVWWRTVWVTSSDFHDDEPADNVTRFDTSERPVERRRGTR